MESGTEATKRFAVVPGHDPIYVFTKLTPLLLWRSCGGGDVEAERPVGTRLSLIRGEMIVAWTKLVMVRITGFWVYFGGR